jgi:hypothetical protein
MSESGWFVSAMTTTVGVVCEKASASGANLPFASRRMLELHGYSVQTASSLAASTVSATLRVGASSGVGLSSTPVALDTPEFAMSVDGLKITGQYFAIAAGTTHATGLVASMWGDYA